jgi:hypothetical protein
MSDVVIFGSSHVKRLDNFIIANPFLNNFRLQKFRITFHGISGGRINNPQDIMEFEHLIQTHNPRFVFVHLGGGRFWIKRTIHGKTSRKLSCAG